MRSLTLNGMEFKPHPDAEYRFDYGKMLDDVKPKDYMKLYRKFCLEDLWFVIYFVMKVPVANHPFVINAAREVEEGPDTETLDLWAREHFKSVTITQAETIQDILKNPNETICILSYARAPALAFLRSVKNVLESSEFLKACFPEILYQDPAKDAFRWSEDAGLFVKRDSFAKEGTLEAWGLIDGQPTGRHFSKLVYDDVVTAEVARSPEMMQKVKEAFDMSVNVGTADGRRRVIGTFYHHDDPLVYIKDMKDRESGDPIFTTRIKPATHDGEPNGEPVLLPQKRLAILRAGDPYIFNCQQLLNPTPTSEIPLSPDFLREIEPGEIPKNLFKFMVVDPAGMETKTVRRGDAWAMLVIGVQPVRDDIGASRVFILDAIIEPMNEVQAMDNVVDIYSRNGRILKLGVEKVGISTMEIHVANALRAKGIFLSIDAKNLVLLRPAGRSKQTRIERNLAWPLANGKIHISKAIPSAYRERLKIEMEKFPYWHDDSLDALAYVYDIMSDYTFGPAPTDDEEEEDPYDRYQKRFEEKYGEMKDEHEWLIV